MICPDCVYARTAFQVPEENNENTNEYLRHVHVSFNNIELPPCWLIRVYSTWGVVGLQRGWGWEREARKKRRL